jgi:DNA-binding MarR family transcriptional regulator
VPDVAQLLHQLLLSSYHVASANRQRARLSPLEYAAVQLIGRHSEGLTPTQLGSYLGITSGAITKVVDRLEQRGLVTRRRDRADRRSITIAPAEPARRLVQLEQEAIAERLRGIDSAMSLRDRQGVILFLQAAALELDSTRLLKP